MTADTIHTCSYYCERPGCIKRQLDELRDRLEAVLGQQPAVPSGDVEAVLRMFLTGDGYIAECDIPHIVAALANQAQATEIEALRAEVAAWRELSDHVRVGACAAIWPDRYIDERIRDVAAALKRAERVEEALRKLEEREQSESFLEANDE